ncbi:MAG: bifunctional precorrin-2 dehydrogenase/sirohydrochlorin ferrochelatase [Candidatus Bathyarchaeia archaeon]
MLLDLNLRKKTVVVFGGGIVATRKVVKLIDANARVTVVSSSFSPRLLTLRKRRKLSLRKTLIKEHSTSMNNLISQADLVVAATSESRINRGIASRARKAGIAVSLADNPMLSDFSFPATTKIGPVRVALYTEGKSPGMAGLIRRRLERIITKEDILQVELQSYTRQFAKKALLNQRTRKAVLFRITNDNKIRKLLKRGKLNQAKIMAQKIVTTSAKSQTRIN